MKPSSLKKSVSAIIGFGLIATSSITHASVIFTDDYSNGSVTVPTTALPGVNWVVNSAAGTFTADGTYATQHNAFLAPEANVLNFATGGTPLISVAFGGAGGIVSSTPFSLTFDLRQEDGGGGNQGINIALIDSTANSKQTVYLTANSGYFGTSGFALFASEGGGQTVGTAGTALVPTTAWQTIKITFNPAAGANGVTEVYQNDALKLSYGNGVVGYNTIDTIQFGVVGADFSWFVDNVSIDATAVPEPTTTALLLMVGTVGFLSRRRSARA